MQVCSICLDDFQVEEELRLLPCGHRFHSMCIDPWLLQKSSCCPLCKRDFSRDMNNPSSLTEAPVTQPQTPLPGHNDASTEDERVVSRRSNWPIRSVHSRYQNRLGSANSRTITRTQSIGPARTMQRSSPVRRPVQWLRQLIPTRGSSVESGSEESSTPSPSAPQSTAGSSSFPEAREDHPDQWESIDLRSLPVSQAPSLRP
ncbi:hypothetical protein BJ684DRAFT_10931 [Piptocephalis cylindrospora]|uniref:RING-type domain-containing protein n=1 Tax=Piptocephalis cylindrospora TaxID=1907219 RepID=A0A4P9Y1W6_9FUNG|nr:hypothetical protein BJ684DRAFT_10931 [Piptocephalis cylindrospora]|eukprot:RKP12838.1 hypothetical protein BJ684DRAFT_10931 [Piptocephalis cylindrospora]